MSSFLLQGFALAIKMGVTKQQLDSLVGLHPTAGEEVLGMKGPDRVVNAPDRQPQDSSASEGKQSASAVASQAAQSKR